MEPCLYEAIYRLQKSHWWFLSRQRFLDVLLRQLGKGGRVLDAGCGPGSMLHYLAAFGEVTGLDRHLPALQMAQSHFSGQLVQGSLDRLPFSDEQFFLVNATEVLYHRTIADVQEALAELVRVLEPGGWLLVVDSAYGSLASGHDEIAHGARRFTRPMLMKACREAGLEIVHATYAYSLLLPVVWLVRRWKALRPKGADLQPELQPAPKFLNHILSRWFSLEAQVAGRWGLPFGLSVQVLGRKAGGRND